MLENIEGTIKNGQSREICIIGYTTRRKTQHDMCGTALWTNKHKGDMNTVYVKSRL